jgi:outer membrane protein TolC
MEARTLVAQARAQLYPTLSVAPTYTYSHPSGNLKNTIGTTGASGSTSNKGATPNSELATLPFSASWAPDLWGRVRNLIHEQQYNAQLSAADLENEKLTEQASLAVFFFELRGQDALQRVLDDTVAADKRSVELNRARYETGVDSEISLVQAQNALDNAEAEAVNVGLLRAQL